jgi:hypothetical protein
LMRLLQEETERLRAGAPEAAAPKRASDGARGRAGRTRAG